MLRSNTLCQIAGCFNVPAFWRERWEFLKKLSEWCLGDYKILKSCKNRSTFKSLKRFNFIISLETIATITQTTSCYFIGRRWDRNRITSFCSDVSSLRGGEWHLNQAYSHASELFCHTTLAIACSMDLHYKVYDKETQVPKLWACLSVLKYYYYFQLKG